MVAIRLASAGRQVTLLEKESTAHHKVCGEFLSPEAVEYLNQAGINPLDLGAATIRFVRLSSKQRTVETVLPFTALSLSRFTLGEFKQTTQNPMRVLCRLFKLTHIERVELSTDNLRFTSLVGSILLSRNRLPSN
jgi:2-polyprenyl-6-methoxyphenol hydroxylase-like FAD-dependent oxidoreductase